MKTIVIANQKGGSGKSTSTVQLAVAAEQAGDGPVLISDTDPQGSTGKRRSDFDSAESDADRSARPGKRPSHHQDFLKAV